MNVRICIKEIILFRKMTWKNNRHLYFPLAKELYLIDCDREFILQNVSKMHFPQLETVSMPADCNANSFMHVYSISLTNRWKIDKFDKMFKYKFDKFESGIFVANEKN
jgi:CRISPR/Cas system CMR-associated protein Cmr3 (group 5 of RAMP superfamily)